MNNIEAIESAWSQVRLQRQLECWYRAEKRDRLEGEERMCGGGGSFKGRWG